MWKAAILGYLAALAMVATIGILRFVKQAAPSRPTAPPVAVALATLQPSPSTTVQPPAPPAAPVKKANKTPQPARSAPPPPVLTPAARAGAELFRHQWTVKDPLAKGGDGLGPVYNATSCLACHFQNGAGGSGGLTENVTVFTARKSPTNVALRIFNGLLGADGTEVREGVVHAHSTLARAETLQDVHADLPPVARPPLNMVLGARKGDRAAPGVHLSQRNTPALFGSGLIDEISDQDILANEERQKQRWAVGAKAKKAQEQLKQGGLSSFDGSKENKAALEKELVAQLVKTSTGRALRLEGGKLGRFGWKAQSASLASFVRAACANELGLGNPSQAQARPLFQPNYQPPGLDLTNEQCDQMTAYIASLPRPEEIVPTDPDAAAKSRSGKQLFKKIGCADCHTPDLGTAKGLYSDLLLHDMGPELEGGGSYNEAPAPVVAGKPGSDRSLPGEWRTPPLWGVADSAPYIHDGRASTLEEAILLHHGQATSSAVAFSALGGAEQTQLIAFLKTLRAPAEAVNQRAK